MKLIQVHNYYQIKGGEDTVVAAEKALLESNGHTVITYYRRNEELNAYSSLEKLKLLRETSWSQKTYDTFSDLLQKEKPDVCHIHNFLPLISPSIYYACRDSGVPIVQTLHNYRLICTNGLLLRNEQICELCLGKSAMQSVTKKCYRNSHIQTYAVAKMLEKHKKKNTWNEVVDAYICLTEFAKSKFIAHGLPAEKLMVKPNFIPQLEIKTNTLESPYFIYVGRLTESKGVHLFKTLAGQLPIPIKVVGEGALSADLKDLDQIEVLGKRSTEETLALIQNAVALILPSLWYEGMPMTILEAFSLKTPVITSDLGAMQSMIAHGSTGLLFEPGSAKELKENLNFAFNKKEELLEIAENAFENYLELYSPEANYTQLMKIYSALIAKNKE